MMMWSHTRTFLAGAALILATNVVALLGVAYNRAGEPESVLMLTQRELLLPYSWGLEFENSGLALRLHWRLPSEDFYAPFDSPISRANIGNGTAWLDKARLDALGFDVSQPEGTPDGHLYYEKLLPKDVLLVLELNGATYQAALEHARRYLQQAEALLAANAGKKEFEQRVSNARERLDREEHASSRLFIIDAGLDLTHLRAKYPDPGRYAIVRGQIEPRLIVINNVPRLSGYISGLSINQIHVPLAHRAVFEPSNSPQAGRPGPPSHYQVSVAYGERLEPWITAASATRGSE